MSVAGWRMADVLTRGGPLDRAALALEAEFRQYHFTTCRSRKGRSLAAVRKRDADGPGVCVVITPDAEEMRRVLRGDPPAQDHHRPGFRGSVA